MLHNTKELGQLLTAKEMKKVWGGAGPRRKNVCVICGPGDVRCASVPATAECQVFDYVAPPPSDPEGSIAGWMGCKDGSGEGWDILEYHCV